MKKLRVSNNLTNTFRHLHPEIKKKVKAVLQKLIEKPAAGKPLYWQLEGLYSYKIGHFRLIYRQAENIIEIIAFGPRRVIYEETFRLLKKEI